MRLCDERDCGLIIRIHRQSCRQRIREKIDLSYWWKLVIVIDKEVYYRLTNSNTTVSPSFSVLSSRFNQKDGSISPLSSLSNALFTNFKNRPVIIDRHSSASYEMKTETRVQHAVSKTSSQGQRKRTDSFYICELHFAGREYYFRLISETAKVSSGSLCG